MSRTMNDIFRDTIGVDESLCPKFVMDYIRADIEATKEACMLLSMTIKKVIFNDPATIIIWGNDEKTVVKCGENEVFDPEKGLAMAISKHFFGNKGSYYEEFKKWLPKEEE